MRNPILPVFLAILASAAAAHAQRPVPPAGPMPTLHQVADTIWATGPAGQVQLKMWTARDSIWTVTPTRRSLWIVFGDSATMTAAWDSTGQRVLMKPFTTLRTIPEFPIRALRWQQQRDERMRLLIPPPAQTGSG